MFDIPAYRYCSAYLACLFLIHGFIFPCYSQNLAPNPSFEVYTYCPVGVGGVGNLPAAPWRSATNGTPDYFNACAFAPIVSVPNNGFGFQEAHTGEAYMGSILYGYSPDSTSYREYLLAPLIGGALVKGYAYQVSFYVSLGDNMCAIDKIGAYFSSSRPPASISTPLLVKPQIEANLGIIRDSINWVLISGCFIAKGYEQWITIGNFYDNAHTASDPKNSGDFSYYFIDDIEVVKMGLPEDFIFDLGAQVAACDSYLIDPHLNTVSYQWGNGSQDSTLLVTESGTYTLTVTDGCTQGVDSIEVDINLDQVVDIGPPDLDLCVGDTLLILLDPTLGQYTWQDGSTGNEYTIATGGYYQVILDNGACETSDQLMVHSVEPPGSFSLGRDTVICQGEILSFSADIINVDYVWQDGSTNSFLEVTSSDSVSLTISNDCGSVSDTVFVAVISPPPDFNLGPDTTLCPGESILLQAPSTTDMIYWQDGSHGLSLLADKAQIYSLTLSNQCGNATDDLVLNFDQRVPEINLEPILTWCPGATLTLDATQGIPATYQWNTGSSDPSILVDNPGMYFVDIQAPCSAAYGETEIVLADTCTIAGSFYIPNVFSPNGNNINDVFSLSTNPEIQITALRGVIFDRWGNEVFQSDQVPFVWNGRSHDKWLEPGVYVYSIILDYSVNGLQQHRVLKGDVTLIR